MAFDGKIFNFGGVYVLNGRFSVLNGNFGRVDKGYGRWQAVMVDRVYGGGGTALVYKVYWQRRNMDKFMAGEVQGEVEIEVEELRAMVGTMRVEELRAVLKQVEVEPTSPGYRHGGQVRALAVV